MAEFVIRGGEVVDPSGRRTADVRVRDGFVVEVGDALDGPEVLDATGAIVTPGFVDLHTHLREPGDEDAETIATGSRAAALGGYTAGVAMPNTPPPLDDPTIVRAVLAIGDRKSTRLNSSHVALSRMPSSA